MKKETIYIKQKVILEYEDLAGRKKAIEELKRFPNCSGYYGSGQSWQKADSKVQIIIQKRTPIK